MQIKIQNMKCELQDFSIQLNKDIKIIAFQNAAGRGGNKNDFLLGILFSFLSKIVPCLLNKN